MSKVVAIRIRSAENVIVGHRLLETVPVQYSDDRVLDWPLAELARYPSTRN